MQSAKITIGNYVSKQSDPGWKDQKLKKACKDFESLLTYQLLRSMRKTIDKCDLFHGGQGEEIYQSLFDMQISKRMVGFGPNSLARLLYDQLKGKEGMVTDVPEQASPRPVQEKEISDFLRGRQH